MFSIPPRSTTAIMSVRRRLPFNCIIACRLCSLLFCVATSMHMVLFKDNYTLWLSEVNHDALFFVSTKKDARRHQSLMIRLKLAGSAAASRKVSSSSFP